MLTWALGALAVVVVGMACQMIESMAAMRGQNGEPLSVYVDKTLRACFLLLVLGPVTYILDVHLLALAFPLSTLSLLLYLIPYTSHAELHGGLERPFARDWRIVRWLADYFQIRLVNASNKPLDPSRRYIFCLHPHGVLPIGGTLAMVASRKGGFSELFPGIDMRVVCATFCFYIPVYRELLLGLGFADASRFSARKLLESGKSIALVPGGATEALYCQGFKDVLYLSKRKGFIRLALQQGAALVPVYSFNETNVFQVYQGRDDSWPWIWIEKAKRKFQRIFGISLPIVLNVIPNRAEITTVVGQPMQLPKVEDPKEEEVDKWLAEYTKSVRKLYEDNHAKYAHPPEKPLEVM